MRRASPAIARSSLGPGAAARPANVNLHVLKLSGMLGQTADPGWHRLLHHVLAAMDIRAQSPTRGTSNCACRSDLRLPVCSPFAALTPPPSAPRIRTFAHRKRPR